MVAEVKQEDGHLGQPRREDVQVNGNPSGSSLPFRAGTSGEKGRASARNHGGVPFCIPVLRFAAPDVRRSSCSLARSSGARGRWCSTSRRTTSICRPSSASRPRCAATRARCSWSATTTRSRRPAPLRSGASRKDVCCREARHRRGSRASRDAGARREMRVRFGRMPRLPHRAWLAVATGALAAACATSRPLGSTDVAREPGAPAPSSA